MIRVIRRVYVAVLSRTLEKGEHELPEAVETLLSGTRYAEALDKTETKLVQPAKDESANSSIDLSASDSDIKAFLSQYTESQRDGIWRAGDANAMSDFLVNRAGREHKSGWTLGSMGNMIEKHVGL